MEVTLGIYTRNKNRLVTYESNSNIAATSGMIDTILKNQSRKTHIEKYTNVKEDFKKFNIKIEDIVG